MPLRAARLLALLLPVLLFPTPTEAREHRGPPRRPGAVLYEVRPDAGAIALQRLEAVLHSRGPVHVRKLEGLGIRIAQFEDRDMSEEARCAELRATGAVTFAEPDHLVAPTATPDDPTYSSQWQHEILGSSEAWDVTTGSASVKVAVCDTGVSSTHPDLAANLELPGYNAVDGTTNTEPVYNHGTGVAGCIGAVGNNGTGVAGVAWSVSILPVRITNQADGRAYVSDAADGIRWAADQGARVVNLSYLMAGYATIDSAAQYLRDSGGLLFVAAGNDGQDPGWTDYDSFLAVSATSSSDVLASWSNRGDFVDLAAPGVAVVSTTGTSGYGSMSGTSFASPIAAGVAALLFSIDSAYTPAEVETFLLSSCVDLGATGEDDLYGRGRVDAAAAAALASDTTPNTPPVARITANPLSGTAPLAVAFDGSTSTDADGTIQSWSWDFGDGASGSGSGVSHTYVVAGTHTAQLVVTDERGATSTDTVSIVVDQDPTRVVHVADITMSTTSLPGGWSARATVLVVDAAGQPRPGAAVTGQWTGTTGDGIALGTTGTDGEVTLASKKTKGESTLTLTVTDVSTPGYLYDATRNVETSASITGGSSNTAPTADVALDVSSGAPPLVVSFDGTGSTDADGYVASCAWDFGDGSSASGDRVSHTYESAGTFTAVLVVTDDDGATDRAEVSINVVGDPTKVVYVSSIELVLVPGKGGDVPVARLQLETLDGADAAGAGVTVEWSGIVDGSSSTTAAADGTAVIEGKKTRKTGSITATVVDVALAGYAFDPHLGQSTATVVRTSGAR